MLCQGKVEMEIELVSKDEAEQKPAGCGRDDPNEHPTLDPPKSVIISDFALTGSVSSAFENVFSCFWV